ncbi:SxtJ family membrane protein [Marivirga harenae]|uniref:SxtJ family membrane protein n=1 Tax=Marivirga harenae TaxID=2010992 RepID=UPI00349EEC1A|tara:strand:- start:9618 stop:9977 length:360 start_codon:yes stop_codon:yes gene_type:complete
MEDVGKYRNVLIITAGFLLFYLFFDVMVLLYISVSIAVLGGLSPKVAQAINWLWMKLAFLLGWVNTRILLSIIFYLFLTPIALVSRLFTKDPLRLKKPKSSNFEVRNHLYNKEELENIW